LEGERSVASSKDRQRKLAREKLDRQLARRAAQERRRRRVMAGVGAGLAVVLILAGVAWLGGMFDGDKTDDTAASGDTCAWTPQNAQTNTDLQDVGTPPTKDIPTSGTRPMTITTNQGAPIVVSLDLTKAPCSSESLTYLAGKKFYDSTECTEITTDGALRCGDPKGTGLGGPTYSIYNENAPSAPAPSASAGPASKTPLYPKGTVALIGNPPGTNGSQFLLFFKDFSPADPQYSIVGTITAGMDTLTKISKIPTVANATGSKVKPKEKVLVKTLTVGAVGADSAPSAAPSASNQS
jgi:peptidyl-prolyl cis-trans isomerase B (cyclophilin B)